MNNENLLILVYKLVFGIWWYLIKEIIVYFVLYKGLCEMGNFYNNKGLKNVL